jgi:hypothetical protein
MNLAKAFFVLALLLTATVALPIAVAALAQRQTRAALWLRAHVRGIWAITALFWLASLLLKLTHGSNFAGLDVVVTALGFACTVALAMLHRPAGADTR